MLGIGSAPDCSWIMGNPEVIRLRIACLAVLPAFSRETV